MSWYSWIRPLLFQFDPEFIHHWILDQGERWQQYAGILRLLEGHWAIKDSRLERKIWGLSFPNPVGIAAGFDKNGTILPLLAASGLGFIEVGSISALSSPGNPRPRLFRIPADQGIINRMGLNNIGAQAAAQNFSRWKKTVPVGINICKTHDPQIWGAAAIQDFATSARLLAPFADYLAINISCPNTREGKTFEQDRGALAELLQTLRPLTGKVPLLLKLSPDLGDQDLVSIIDLVQRYQVDGLIAGNTTTSRANLATPSSLLKKIGAGGLSGKPLANMSTQLLKKIAHLTAHSLPLIGVGGIFSPADAWEKLAAGASLVQLYTGLIYQGPGLIGEINRQFLQHPQLEGKLP